MSLTLKKPSPEEVGLFYDQITRFFEIMWGDSIHVGYWPDGDTGGSISEAQERFTELLIGKVGIRAGQHLLDVGCGTGRPAIRLAQATGCRVTGITISRAQVEEAKRRVAAAGLGERISIQLANAMELPFPAESFDAAWAFESIFHMPDRTQVLREVARVLRPGGRVVIADIVASGPMSPEEEALLCEVFKVNSFVRVDDYRAITREAGFELEEILDVGANIKRTMALTTEDLARKSPELRRVYGEEFVTMMGAAWPRAASAYDRCLGYVVVTAHKPRVSRG